jgi:hypothetical protein
MKHKMFLIFFVLMCLFVAMTFFRGFMVTL